MLELMEVDVTYCFVTSYQFNSLKDINYLFAHNCSGQSGPCRDSFAVFHIASAQASSAGLEEPTQDASSRDWQVVTAVA